MRHPVSATRQHFPIFEITLCAYSRALTYIQVWNDRQGDKIDPDNQFPKLTLDVLT